MNTVLSTLSGVNLVVAVGSVDGVCTSAAVLRHAAPDTQIFFTQPSRVSGLKPKTWGDARRILLVNLAVDAHDETKTVKFLKACRTAGHTIVGILDEHDMAAWFMACMTAEIGWDTLAIQPVSRNDGKIKSSGALLAKLLGSDADPHTRELCDAADAGDRMDFATRIGTPVNRAMKSNPEDVTRRPYLARHFAQSLDPDEKIAAWALEYDTILRTHEFILADLVDLGDGIAEIDATGKVIDLRTLLTEVYSRGNHAVIMRGDIYHPDQGKKMPQLAVSFSPEIPLGIDEVLGDAGIPFTGGPGKRVNVLPEFEEDVISALRSALS